jgi:4-aminobutyrate aminotransferase
MCTIWDVDGNEFLDFTAGIGVTNCGHSHPGVVKAIQKQAESLIHMCTGDYYNEPCKELSERLAKEWPGPCPAKVFFTNSGTESVEGAIKLARYATKRQRMIAFLGAFHGRTCGSLSLTASKTRQREGFGPMLAGVDHAPYNDLEYVKTLFKKTVPPKDVAAIFVEPLQGEGGYIPAQAHFMQGLRKICDDYGIMLVADEVQSGFGRTGKMFCIEHFGVEPDIMCLAKGIANGMPLGAVMARKSVMDAWEPGSHGSTYGGCAVSLAAANASLSLIKGEYMKNASVIGSELFQGLANLHLKLPRYVCYPTGLGMMLGVEIRAFGAPNAKLRDAIVDRAFQKGLVLLGCGESTVRVCPPLCLTKSEAEKGVKILGDAIEEAIKKHDMN